MLHYETAGNITSQKLPKIYIFICISNTLTLEQGMDTLDQGTNNQFGLVSCHIVGGKSAKSYSLTLYTLWGPNRV